MWNNLYDYENDIMTSHEMTFHELCEKLGLSEVFSGTSVDATTQNDILNYFLLDRLCAPEKRFLWLFRRRLNIYFPIYKNEVDMWAERTAEKWFFDNFKEEIRNRKGTGTEQEDTTTELRKAFERIFSDTFTGKRIGGGTGESSTDTNGATQDHGETESSGNENGKTRGFAFAYPESNYQGGVIPYDLNNDPSVEFISTQNDGISKSNTISSGTSNSNGSTEDHTTSNNSYSNSEDTNNSGSSKANETGTDTGTGARSKSSADTVDETVRRQGDNINKLAEELISQIPTTDFFKKFMDKISDCFQKVYLLDELLEEKEE